MRHLISRFNGPTWIVLGLSLLAAWAFIVRPSLPRETDAELHVFRAAELGYSLRAGTLYPRWAPDFYYGYGYPIFNYYAPLTYYLANLLSLSVPSGAVFGVKMVFILGLVLAGYSVFHLARTSTTPIGGIIAAASYLFAPYIYLIDPHLRGDLAEFFALAVGPAAFASLSAFMAGRDRRSLMLSSLSVAALILTHNLLALIYFAMLLAYCLWRLAVDHMLRRAQSTIGNSLIVFLPLVTGVLLSAFFWLPIALERNAVQLSNLVGPGHFDYRNHFLTLTEMFWPSIPLDLGAVNPAFCLNLGVAQWILAGSGVLALIVAYRAPVLRATSGTYISSHGLADAGFWLIGFAILVILMLNLSGPLWDAVPLMAFLQFPWRLLGPAAMCLAMLAAHTTNLIHIAPPRTHRLLESALVILPILFALPIFIPPDWENFGPADQLAMLDFELNGLALGTTSTGDFVPVEVDVVPNPNSDLIESYRRGGPVDKVNRHTLPDGASVKVERHGPTYDVLTVSSPEPFVLRLYTFMFAGWRASIDGQPAPIEVAKPEGFITVPIPAGEHTVRVWLGTTPARSLAWLISALGGVMIVLAARRLPAAASVTPAPLQHGYRPVAIALVLCAATAGMGGALRMFQPRSQDLVAFPAQYSLHAYVQGGVDLIGYSLPDATVRPGDSLDLTLYWKAREPVAGNYQVFAHLTTRPEHAWAQSDKLNPGDYPTSRWPMDRYVRDPHTLTIPPGTPPGQYSVLVGLWNHGSGIRQLVLDEDGTILGDAIKLPVSVTVLPAHKPPNPVDIPLDLIIGQEIAPGLILLGGQQEPQGVFSDTIGLLKLTLYWQARRNDLGDYEVLLRIVDACGTEITRTAGRPADGQYPMSVWASDEVVRDIHSFWIDENIRSGMYRIEIALAGVSGQVSGWLTIAEFERRLD